MRVEQVMFRSGPVRCAGDLYLPDGADASMRAAGVVMGHSVIMVKEALAPHAEYLVRAGSTCCCGRRCTSSTGLRPRRCCW